MTKNEIRRFRPQNNLVVLKPIMNPGRISFNGTKLYIDTSWKPENHVPVMCQVITMPSYLIYTRDFRRGNSMEWKTRIEIVEDDRVFVNYLQGIDCIKIYDEDNQEYWLLDYGYIYCAIRRWDAWGDDRCRIIIPEEIIPSKEVIEDFTRTGILLYDGSKGSPMVVNNREARLDCLPENVIERKEDHGGYDAVSYWKVVMVNGYVLVELERKVVKELVREREVIIQDRGFVRYMGRPNIQYRDKVFWDDDYLRIGDYVQLRYKYNKVLERNVDKHFPDGRDYVVTQRRRIEGIFERKMF